MVGADHTNTNGGLYKLGEGGGDTDKREDTLSVDLMVKVELALGNVADEVWGRMKQHMIRCTS